MPNQTHLGLVRIARETVQERVYVALRERLMRGGFEPGQKLKIAELSEAFGTSSMPVREALNRLAVERALETLPSRTVRVPALSRAALEDLREARFAIEGLAIARAAAHMSAETLATLRRYIEEQSQADSDHVSEGSAELNRGFHFAIYRQIGVGGAAADHREPVAAIRPLSAGGLGALRWRRGPRHQLPCRDAGGAGPG